VVCKGLGVVGFCYLSATKQGPKIMTSDAARGVVLFMVFF
jgi:hypothetical protein